MSVEVITFPDVEALLVAHLPQLVGVPVKTAVPNPRPATWIRVTRAGGRQVRLNADSALVIFECWAPTTTQASALAQRARAYVKAMAGTDLPSNVWVFRVEEASGPQFFPDPDTDSPRYQFTVYLDTKGVAL